MDSQLSPMKKRELNRLNIEEARGWTITSLLRIETILDNFIIDYYIPRHKVDFKRVMLNSSVIDFGGKCKIIANITPDSKKLIEKIRRLTAIRNAFAHASIIEHHNITFHAGKKVTIKTSRIDVMNSSGKIDSKNALDYLVEFNGILTEVDLLLKEVVDGMQSRNNPK